MSMYRKSFIFAWILLVSFSAVLFAEDGKTKHNLIFDLNDIEKSDDGSLHEVCEIDSLYFELRDIIGDTQSVFQCIEKSLILKNVSSGTNNPNWVFLSVKNKSPEDLEEKISEIYNLEVKSKHPYVYRAYTLTNRIEAFLISSLEELTIPLKEQNSLDQIVSMINDRGPDFVKFVQFSMQNAGYYTDDTGNVDGGFGTKSIQALKTGLNEVTKDAFGVDIIDIETFLHSSDRVIKVLFNGAIKVASSEELNAQNKELVKNSEQDTAPNEPEDTQPVDTSENGQAEKDANKNDQEDNKSFFGELKKGMSLGEKNAKLTAEKKELEEINKRLEEKNKRLEEELKNKKDTKELFSLQLGDLLNLNDQLQNKRDELTYKGQLPDKKIVDVRPVFEFKNSCSFNANETLNDAIKKYFKKSCTNITLENYDVDDDPKRPRIFDQKSNTLTIPILIKQASQITSIKSDLLTNLETNFDKGRCDINVDFYNKDSKSVIKWDAGPVKIYVEEIEENTGQFYLSDLETIKNRSIDWGDRRFKLVVQNQNDSSCEISEPDSFFEFFTEDEFTDQNSSPTAVISRDGSVVLKNLPLKQAKGKTLAVFLDTFVGPDRDAPLFGFNKAMIDEEFKILQKVYFKGFLNAVNRFILEKPEFGNVEIFERSNESETNYRNILSKTKVNFNEFEKFKDDYISNDFIAGSKGIPLKKKNNHTQLLVDNKNTVFVSFGSSGHNYEKACSSESRRDYKLNFHIFDIWPQETLESLSDNNQLTAIVKKRAYRCKDAVSIMGLKISDIIEEHEIENIIYDELKRISE